jgi:hypothetical protein
LKHVILHSEETEYDIRMKILRIQFRLAIGMFRKEADIGLTSNVPFPLHENDFGYQEIKRYFSPL